MRLVLLSILLAMASCQGGGAADAVGELPSPLYGEPGYYWPSHPLIVNVCWDNASSGNITTTDGSVIPEATARQWVRDVVEQNWNRFGRVNFTNWTTTSGCPTLYAGAPNVHLQVVTTGNSVTNYPGKLLDGHLDGISLDLYWTSGNPTCLANAVNIQNCIVAQSVHEFGHALGFDHENARPDSGNVCATDGDMHTGTQYYGAVDTSSVMWKCQNQPPNWFTAISPGDIAGFETIYQRRPSGLLVDARSARCFSSNITPSNLVFGWACDEANGQLWVYDFIAHTFGVSTSGTSGKLDSNGHDTIGTSPFVNTTTTGTIYQQFTMNNMFFRNGWGGLCLDLINGDTTNGNHVQLYQCGAAGGANQKWTLESDYAIHFGTSSKCLTYTGTNGDLLQIWDCGASGKHQHVNPLNDGSIVLTDFSAKCIDAQAPTSAQYAPTYPASGVGVPSNGTPIQTYTCTSSQINQKWNLSGPIVNHNGYCLDAGSAEGYGNQDLWETCNGSLSQTFDYYFDS